MTLETETVLDRRRCAAASRSGAALPSPVGLRSAALLFADRTQPASFAPQQIARIAIEGTITDDRDQLAMLKKIKDAKHVDGVLVFVNSPGGTTTGGESLYGALREVAEKKPVVAQFGTVAASAGYIVGLGTDHIVARGNTITGSVGVLAQWPEVSELLSKLGVKFNEVKSGELKAAPNPFRAGDRRRPLGDAGDDRRRIPLVRLAGRDPARHHAPQRRGLVRGASSRAARRSPRSWSTRSAARPRRCAGSRKSAA